LIGTYILEEPDVSFFRIDEEDAGIRFF